MKEILRGSHGPRCMIVSDSGEWVEYSALKCAQSELAELREENERLKIDSFEALYNALIDERDALLEELARITDAYRTELDELAGRNYDMRFQLAAAEQRNSTRDIEFAAKVLANCMDYPWEHMPDNGRVLMRKHAKDIVDAALKPTESGASE